MISNFSPKHEEYLHKNYWYCEFYYQRYYYSLFFHSISLLRMPINKRLLSGSHSSHSNLSQASVTSDLLGADDMDSPTNAQHTKIAERRSNSNTDIQGKRVELESEMIILYV